MALEDGDPPVGPWAAVAGEYSTGSSRGSPILHIGDASMDPQLFAPYDLASRDLDIALIPYWFFTDPTIQETIEYFRIVFDSVGKTPHAG